MTRARLRAAVAAAGAFCTIALACIPEAGASETTRIGYLDQSQIEASRPFRDAAAQLQTEKVSLDAEYAQAMRRARSATEQAHLNAQFTQRFTDRQATVLGPVFARARAVIANVAARRGMTVVVDRRIVIVGGSDVTAAVIARLQSSAPLATAPALPPASVGYVDQDAVNAVPKVKSANDRYQAALKAIAQTTTQRLKDAKNDGERNQVAQQDQDSQDAKRHDIIDPVVASVNDVISSVAAQDHLLLVVDKTAVMAGGRDVTSDVVAGLR